MSEALKITIFPRQGADQGRMRAEMFRVTGRTLVATGSRQKSMESLVRLQLPRNLHVTLQATSRQSLLGVTGLTCAQSRSLDNFSVGRRQRPRHGVEHAEINAQQADHEQTKQQWPFGVG